MKRNGEDCSRTPHEGRSKETSDYAPIRICPQPLRRRRPAKIFEWDRTLSLPDCRAAGSAPSPDTVPRPGLSRLSDIRGARLAGWRYPAGRRPCLDPLPEEARPAGRAGSTGATVAVRRAGLRPSNGSKRAEIVALGTHHRVASHQNGDAASRHSPLTSDAERIATRLWRARGHVRHSAQPHPEDGWATPISPRRQFTPMCLVPRSGQLQSACGTIH